MSKKTALYEFHLKNKGNIVEFAGFYLPIYYTSIQEEHFAVRNSVGVFDVSHMGNFELKAKDKKSAVTFLNYIFPNDFSSIYPGKCIYTTMLNQNARVIDDLIVSCLNDTDYHIVVNASNIDKDFNWIKSVVENFKDISLINSSDFYSIIAIQGPKSEVFMKSIGYDIEKQKSFTVKEYSFNGSKIIISKTGYTGEKGCEVILENKFALDFINKINENASNFDLKFCGLGARDTLRLEAALPLYGHELDENHSPLQTNIAWSVKLNKESDFIGKSVLINEREKYREYLFGFEVLSRSIPRNSMNIFDKNGKRVGYVTSGSFSPTLQKNIGLAYIEKEYANDANLKIEIRNRLEDIKIVPLPFYLKK